MRLKRQKKTLKEKFSAKLMWQRARMMKRLEIRKKHAARRAAALARKAKKRMKRVRTRWARRLLALRKIHKEAAKKRAQRRALRHTMNTWVRRLSRPPASSKKKRKTRTSTMSKGKMDQKTFLRIGYGKLLDEFATLSKKA